MVIFNPPIRPDDMELGQFIIPKLGDRVICWEEEITGTIIGISNINKDGGVYTVDRGNLGTYPSWHINKYSDDTEIVEYLEDRE